MKVLMIGNAHLDPVWTWRWNEGYSEIISTCLSALKILDEFETAVFTRGEAAMYKWIEETNPDIFKRIRDYVKQKRWNIVNGWWIQPDCNIPNGESFIRQALYGKQYFMKKFGIEPSIGYNVDSFGHAGSLPQILVKTGYDGYVFMRPGKHEKKLPSLFNWKSRDGSQIKAFRISNAYTVHEDNLTEQINDTLADSISDLPFTMCFYGVGNHGGGPTKEQIKYILNHKNFNSHTKLSFGTCEEYFKQIDNFKNSIKTVRDELQYHAVGCYSVHSKIKKTNRLAENNLLDAEKWNAISIFTTKTNNEDNNTLEELWQTLLFNQFHDILAGSSIKEAYDDAQRELGGMISAAQKIKNRAYHNILKHIDTKQKGIPFIVFNPSGFDREEYLEFEPWLGQKPWGNVVTDNGFTPLLPKEENIDWKTQALVDSNGNNIEYQKITPASPKRFVHRILFKAKIPSFGYKVFWLKETNQLPETNQSLCQKEGVIDNGLFKVFYNQEGISVIYENNKEEINWHESNQFISVQDQSDTWSHGIASYEGKEHLIPLKEVTLIENGNLRTRLQLTFTDGLSHIIQIVSIRKNDPEIHLSVKVKWEREHHLLKHVFKFNNNVECISEVPYSTEVRKENGQEYPMQRFLGFEDDNGDTFGILNDSQYSYDFRNGKCRITILRSVPYAWHDPFTLPKKHHYDYIDKGYHEYQLSLIKVPKHKQLEIVKRAEALNSKMDVISAPKHDGTFPKETSIINLFSQNAIISSLKLSEDGENHLVFRITEYLGIHSNQKLTILGTNYDFVLHPFEIKTLRFDGTKIIENDMLERSL